jgi:hypothetical protein
MQWAIVIAAFLASAVEFVEAFTLVLVARITTNWRSAIVGALAAVATLAVIVAVEPNAQARAIMANAQQEEFKHFGMDLEFLVRQKPKWRAALQDILFKEGDIVEHGEEVEEAEQDAS